jgi:hypothetical protein
MEMKGSTVASANSAFVWQFPLPLDAVIAQNFGPPPQPRGHIFVLAGRVVTGQRNYDPS